jgi:preprotein translocase subunit SecE
MGRLLKKKPADKKKKTRQKSDSAESPSGNGSTGSQKAGTLVDMSRGSKQKSASSQKNISSATRSASKRVGKGYLDKSMQFLREVKIELKKVTWPSRKQTIGSTVVVIMLVIIISTFLGVVDVGLSSLFRMVLG